MSRAKVWQISHKKKFNNRSLTKNIVVMLRHHGVTTKQAAQDLDLPVWRARNWYYRTTGMTALDLLRMMRTYDFIRRAVENLLPSEPR